MHGWADPAIGLFYGAAWLAQGCESDGTFRIMACRQPAGHSFAASTALGLPAAPSAGLACCGIMLRLGCGHGRNP